MKCKIIVNALHKPRIEADESPFLFTIALEIGNHLYGMKLSSRSAMEAIIRLHAKCLQVFLRR